MKLLVKLLVSTTILFSATSALADEWLRSIPEFELKDHLGEVHSLEKYQDSEYVVFYCRELAAQLPVSLFQIIAKFVRHMLTRISNS